MGKHHAEYRAEKYRYYRNFCLISIFFKYHNNVSIINHIHQLPQQPAVCKQRAMLYLCICCAGHKFCTENVGLVAALNGLYWLKEQEINKRLFLLDLQEEQFGMYRSIQPK